MDFTVTSVGPTFADLTKRSATALRAANRQAGRDIGRLGGKAMQATAKATGRRWYGRALRVKTKIDSSPSSARVTINPARGQAGGWAIAEKGRSGMRPVRARALHIGANYRASAGPARGAGTWSKAVKAVDKAIRPELQDLYGEALSNG